MEQALDLWPAHLVGAGGKGVEPAAVHDDRRQLMAITVGKVNGVLQVIKGAPAVLTLGGLHQFRLAAAAVRGDHPSAMHLPQRSRGVNDDQSP